MKTPVVNIEGETDVDLILSNFEDVLSILRSKYRKLGRYGEDKGGDTLSIYYAFQDKQLLARIARELFDINIAYEVASDPLRTKLEKANKDLYAARKKLVESL